VGPILVRARETAQDAQFALVCRLAAVAAANAPVDPHSASATARLLEDRSIRHP